mmetsp:Transcript_98691/g.284775  ORF Transcript_98691/g.284775 Transcript_98691/m.284775 type:complete len:273 (+) Transcript_98691:457-1275(+)
MPRLAFGLSAAAGRRSSATTWRGSQSASPWQRTWTTSPTSLRPSRSSRCCARLQASPRAWRSSRRSRRSLPERVRLPGKAAGRARTAGRARAAARAMRTGTRRCGSTLPSPRRRSTRSSRPCRPRPWRSPRMAAAGHCTTRSTWPWSTSSARARARRWSTTTTPSTRISQRSPPRCSGKRSGARASASPSAASPASGPSARATSRGRGKRRRRRRSRRPWRCSTWRSVRRSTTPSSPASRSSSPRRRRSSPRRLEAAAQAPARPLGARPSAA